MCPSMKAASRSRNSLARVDGSGNMDRVLSSAFCFVDPTLLESRLSPVFNREDRLNPGLQQMSPLAQGRPRQARGLRPGYAGVVPELRHTLGAEEVLVQQGPARHLGGLLANQAQHAIDENVRLPPHLPGAQR